MASVTIYQPTLTGPHAQATSTGTGNVASLTPPAGAHGFWITASTNGCYLTLDGTTPDSSNGLPLAKDGLPLFLPLVPQASDALKFASQVAGNAVVNVLWLTN